LKARPAGRAFLIARQFVNARLGTTSEPMRCSLIVDYSRHSKTGNNPMTRISTMTLMLAAALSFGVMSSHVTLAQNTPTTTPVQTDCAIGETEAGGSLAQSDETPDTAGGDTNSGDEKAEACCDVVEGTAVNPDDASKCAEAKTED
jgi:hypothetical protein